MARIYPWPTTAVVLIAALTLSACSTVTNGHVASTPMTGPRLAAQLDSGVKGITSAHMQLSFDAGRISITAKGDERIADGTASALDISEDVTTVGTMRMIVVKNMLYLKLPDALNPTDKPWVRVAPDTTDPAMQAFVPVLQDIQYEASMDRYATMAKATSDVREKGADQIDGTSTEHYSLSVIVDRLPADFPQLDTVKAAGIDAIPIDLWVDAQHRVVKLTEHISVGGQQSAATVAMSAFNKPVTITAPPEDQVATP